MTEEPGATPRRAGPPDPHEDPLPCGAAPMDLLAQVCDGHDAWSPHQDGCRHCRRVLAGYRRLWAPIEALAAEPVRAPRSIVDRVLSSLREVAGESGAAVLPVAEGARVAGSVAGSSRVTARVVARCARLAVQDLDGVRIALARLTGPLPGDAPDTGAVAVAVTVVADYGQELHALARRVRARVGEEVETLTGARSVTVSVHIDDVFP